MKKLILFLLRVTLNKINYGPEIEINSDGLFLNSQNITSQTKLSLIQTILGVPNRKCIGQNIVWTYDDIGVYVLINPNGKLKCISLDFIKEEADFSPILTYNGRLLVYGYNIDRNTPIAGLKKISNLVFIHSQYNFYAFTTNYLHLHLGRLEDTRKLEGIQISFNDD